LINRDLPALSIKIARLFTELANGFAAMQNFGIVENQ
jgi:hypothetical protein